MNYYLLALNLIMLTAVVYVFIKVRSIESTILGMRCEFIHAMRKIMKERIIRMVKEEIDKYGSGKKFMVDVMKKVMQERIEEEVHNTGRYE